jgi:hypothetical protein
VARGSRAQVRRVGDRVACTGLPRWFAVEPAPEGGLRVEVADRVAARWQRIDHDLGRVHREALRLRLRAPDAARTVADAAWGLVGAAEPEADAALAIVRATYPLLTVRAGVQLPAVPGMLPPHLQAGFRTPDLREGTRRLFGGGATRPVARAFAGTLIAGEVPDLFAVSALAGAAEVLAPDHVARLLTGAAVWPERTATVRDPLTAAQMASVAPVLAGLHPRRAVRVLGAALATDADRERLRFVLTERRSGGPSFADADGVEELALLVALDVDDVAASDLGGGR